MSKEARNGNRIHIVVATSATVLCVLLLLNNIILWYLCNAWLCSGEKINHFNANIYIKHVYFDSLGFFFGIFDSQNRDYEHLWQFIRKIYFYKYVCPLCVCVLFGRGALFTQTLWTSFFFVCSFSVWSQFFFRVFTGMIFILLLTKIYA